ncbi:flagellar protein FliT [Massilia litorea]|jgi:flagellar protein FliT|uniref:Flagellar protein FliT n=1 Tax=Massilia litorea TaxID=2769491 RepID=A0A7L9UA29_9BURK|nr:flagellar protein FliT [Massilia litorea]QOL51747.1 flagellar protein FliT [Massilia litorea]
MMTGQEVLLEYAAVADLTGQMLAAAEAGDWDHLVVLERACTAHVDTLKRSEAAVELNPSGRQAKIDCIRRILADDRKIRDLTMPWMAQLSALINNSGTQRRLVNAYGSV